MPSYSFPFNRGDVKYKLNELVSQVNAWIVQDYAQFTSFAGIKFSSVVEKTLQTAGVPEYTLIRVSENGNISIKGSYTGFGGKVLVGLYANPTVTDDGTIQNTTCQNLAEFERDAHTTIYDAPTVTADGDLILSFTIYSSANAVQGVASTLTSETRRILRSNNDYLIKATPSVNSVGFQQFFEWTEDYRITENNFESPLFKILVDGDGNNLIDENGDTLIVGR